MKVRVRGWFPTGLVLQQSSEDCAAPALLIEQYPKFISYRNDENGAFCYFTETSSESIFILLQNAAHFFKWTPHCFLLNCVQDCKIISQPHFGTTPVKMSRGSVGYKTYGHSYIFFHTGWLAWEWGSLSRFSFFSTVLVDETAWTYASGNMSG